MGQTLEQALAGILNNGTLRIVLSNPVSGAPFKKAALKKKESGFMAERFTDTQAFHDNIPLEKLHSYAKALMEGGLRQLNSWNEDGKEYGLKLTKDGNVLTNAKRSQPPKVSESHNRVKRSIIPEGSDVPALRDMGVFTAQGKVVSSMYDKYRQINRFLEIIDDVYSDNPPERIKVIDFGCGKSYLTFLLYYYFTNKLGIGTEMLGLDLKEDVIRSCNRAAEKYGYTGLSFKKGDIADYSEGLKADALISLHACDTATDYALYHGVKMDAKAIFAVPCCQHELNGQMKPKNLNLLSRYGVIKERAAALITDAIRANLLTYSGYKTQLLEFVDFEHSPKNIMIRAVKSNIPMEHRRSAFDEAKAVMDEFGLEPTIYRLLTTKNTKEHKENHAHKQVQKD